MRIRMGSEKGTILIEAILGITIAVIIVTGLITALVSSLNNSTFSRGQTIATGYSQQTMELVRSLKDYDYEYLQSSVSTCSSECQFNSSGLLISGSQSINDSSGIAFVRTIKLSNTSTDDCIDSIYAEVNVAWKDSKCTGNTNCHKASLRSCFSNLDYVQLP